MTSKEMKRWLAALGATFSSGKDSHLKVYLNVKRSVLPMHVGDLKKNTERAIRKQLGIE